MLACTKKAKLVTTTRICTRSGNYPKSRPHRKHIIKEEEMLPKATPKIPQKCGAAARKERGSSIHCRQDTRTPQVTHMRSGSTNFTLTGPETQNRGPMHQLSPKTILFIDTSKVKCGEQIPKIWNDSKGLPPFIESNQWVSTLHNLGFTSIQGKYIKMWPFLKQNNRFHIPNQNQRSKQEMRSIMIKNKLLERICLWMD